MKPFVKSNKNDFVHAEAIAEAVDRKNMRFVRQNTVRCSRDVGCYLGLRPKRSHSGERDPQLGITKTANAYLRSLLIECANLQTH